MLGPLRFSELDRAVGGAPTDVLTKRLRDLEEAGVVGRRRARAAGLGDRLRADPAGPRAGAAAARTRALGAELPRPGDGRRDAAGDAAQRAARDPAPAAGGRADDRPADRRAATTRCGSRTAGSRRAAVAPTDAGVRLSRHALGGDGDAGRRCRAASSAPRSTATPRRSSELRAMVTLPEAHREGADGRGRLAAT